MPDMFFLSASGPEPVRSLQESLGTERILWTGRCAVAEYAFEEPASLPRWTLPEETGVVVTETRVVFIDPAAGAGGELHWLWPQHLRVQPGNRDTGRSATVTQIQLVCNGPGGVFPALVFAGGDLATVGDADRLANVLRQSIARFRVEHSGELGLAAPQARMLSRLVIGPEFNNYQGGEGQTVSLLGSMEVEAPVETGPAGESAPIPAAVGQGGEQRPFLDEYASYGAPTGYPGPAAYAGEPADYAAAPADYAAAQADYAAAPADYAAAQGDYAATPGDYAAERPAAAFEPHPYADYPAPQAVPTPHPLPTHPLPTHPLPTHSLPPQPLPPQPLPPQPLPTHSLPPHSLPAHPMPGGQPVRAPEPQYSDLESRAADLAARVASLVSANAGAEQSLERYETQTTNLSSYLAEGDNGQPAEDRAEAVRRTAARFAGNSARARTTGQRPVVDDQSTRQRNG